MTTLTEDFTVVLETIAKKNFVNVETLETRKSDSMDFHDVAVWEIKAALYDAFIAGMKFGSEIK